MSQAVSRPVDGGLPALKLVQSSRTAWRLANMLLVLLAFCVIAMIFVPWQQSAKGTGRVVAFVPQVVTDDLSEVGLVLDNQNARLHDRCLCPRTAVVKPV